jgi:hypothetical protein
MKTPSIMLYNVSAARSVRSWSGAILKMAGACREEEGKVSWA